MNHYRWTASSHRLYEQILCITQSSHFPSVIKSASIFPFIIKSHVKQLSLQCKMATDYCNIIYKSLNSVLEHLNNVSYFYFQY